jgi:hypothetical protein
MHISFLAALVALTASLSVSACANQYGDCKTNDDCCSQFVCVSYYTYGVVSRRILLCIQILTP